MSHTPATAGGFDGLVVDVTGVAAEPASRHAPEDLLVGDFDERRQIDRLAALGQRVIERLRLSAVAGEAIEDRAIRGVRLIEKRSRSIRIVMSSGTS